MLDPNRRLNYFIGLATVGTFLLAVLGYFSGLYGSFLERRLVYQLNGVFVGSYWCQQRVGDERPGTGELDNFGTYLLTIQSRLNPDRTLRTRGFYSADRGTTSWTRPFDDNPVIDQGFYIKIQSESERLHVQIPFFGSVNVSLEDSPNTCTSTSFQKIEPPR